MANVNVNISKRFYSFVNDWDYEQYLLLGGYGSGKSYSIAQKLVLKLLEEKRLALVVRNVKDTFKDSCFAVLKEVIEQMGMLSEQTSMKSNKDDGLIRAVQSPMEFRFPNGSRIIFKGLDNAEKIKSIHGVSIVWIEECSEIKYDAYKELLGRIRQPNVTLHFILSCNPVGKENWVYRHFFVNTTDDGKENVICDEQELYKRRTMIVSLSKKQKVYIHHSLPDDNPYLPQSYIDRLDALKYNDPQLWVVARWGRFGANGTKVLPQFVVAKNASLFKTKVTSISSSMHFFGLDFGFEESYNALISCCVDEANKILYIYDEVYMNKVTDDRFADMKKVRKVMNRAERCEKAIGADSAEPKTIQFYRQKGYNMYGARKYIGSRLQNTKKMKRFKKIVCSPKCTNTIRELKYLTYKKDSHGNVIYDEFNIDPHTFKYHKLGVYKTMEKLERLKCRPERKLYSVWLYNTHNA